jgi:hypothetical protein
MTLLTAASWTSGVHKLNDRKEQWKEGDQRRCLRVEIEFRGKSVREHIGQDERLG